MRIVLTSRIFSPEPGAASFRLAALADALDAAGHQVVVMTTAVPGNAQASTRRSVELRRAPVLRDKSGYVRGYIQYLSFDVPLGFRLLFGGRYDFVITEPPPTTGVVVRLACAIRRIPYGYYAADIWADASQQTGASSFVIGVVRAMERWALRGARTVFSVSEGVTTRLAELGIDQEVVTVGNGIDTAAFSSAGPTIERTGPLFVYGGTASEWHGAQIFALAFATVRERHPDARLVFIGGGSERETIAQWGRDNSIEGIEFLAAMSAEQLAVWLRGATASLASVNPGGGYDFAFPTKLYGSAACGTPLIYTGLGPAIEFVNRTVDGEAIGVAVSFTKDAVAEAMLNAIAEPASDSRRAAVASWASSEVSLEGVAARIVAAVSNSGV